VGPVVSTAEVEDNINGGPPRRHCQHVRQRSPPSLKMTSMAGPLGGALPVGPATSTTEVEDDVNGRPWGALPVGPVVSTTEF
jgi:hypothetical protein